MPVQQEMVSEEDYFDWENEKEVHGYKTVTITGQEEGWSIVESESGTGNTKIFRNNANVTPGSKPNEGISKITSVVYCTHFKNITGQEIRNVNNLGVTIWGDGAGVWFRAPYTTVEDFTAWLQAQYTAGTPVVVKYPLATPTELPFTEAQKSAKEQIKSLHSYKNVTHIFSTDEVAPITDVTYFKDLETVINNNKQETETRLEAIETLLSTTGTSAMLLDNMQTDLESEVNEI